jgi:8-oxo-dGTP pyrophosphatase MutT (NUDIX family)
MRKAAGILIVTQEKRALFLKRGPGSDHPGEWAFPGGGQEEEDEDDLRNTAIRETLEESGYTVEVERLRLWTRGVAPAEIAGAGPPVMPAPAGLLPDQLAGAEALPPSTDVDFTTYLCVVDTEFVPKLCHEHTGWAWACIENPPEPLHPGARIALQRFSMNELDVARAIQNGQLTSPQQFENVTLFAMRVTGTGLSYRDKIGEHVWRTPEIYLSPEFVERCNALPVVMMHPKKKAALDTEEFVHRIVGIIMFAYVKGDEVWGIARIYDADAASLMIENKLSTSPAVMFRDPSVNSRVRLEDGSPLLIEGEPTLLDHLAICEKGVWDKDGPPAGIDVSEESFNDSETIPTIDPSRLRLLTAKAAYLDLQMSNLAASRRRSINRH